MSISIDVGTRDPAYATSLGRVLLASLPPDELARYLETAELEPIGPRTLADRVALGKELARVARQGYALVDQELEEGLRAVAVPIHDADGRVVAALNVAVHASRWTIDAIRRELLPRCRRRPAVDRDAVEAAPGPAIPSASRPSRHRSRLGLGTAATSERFVESLHAAWR